jgi:hypothetical protein
MKLVSKMVKSDSKTIIPCHKYKSVKHAVEAKRTTAEQEVFSLITPPANLSSLQTAAVFSISFVTISLPCRAVIPNQCSAKRRSQS